MDRKVDQTSKVKVGKNGRLAQGDFYEGVLTEEDEDQLCVVGALGVRATRFMVSEEYENIDKKLDRCVEKISLRGCLLCLAVTLLPIVYMLVRYRLGMSTGLGVGTSMRAAPGE
eukprot:GFYU01003751.1.p1 GENE.GFYU01003751.1~~GFYU01003751.1.p1  ORF type:complete len:114 (+),score=13.02 GFYU01003751.1:31-372(+)